MDYYIDLVILYCTYLILYGKKRSNEIFFTNFVDEQRMVIPRKFWRHVFFLLLNIRQFYPKYFYETLIHSHFSKNYKIIFFSKE